MKKSEEELEKIAQDIVDDIYEEHGDFAPHGTIDLMEAEETVSCYGYEGEELTEIAKYVVVLMEGEL